jgi:protease I
VKLQGRRVAVLLERDYQDLEVWYPVLRFREEGATVDLVAPAAGDYKGKFGYPATADKTIDQVRPADYDAVVIPGGWAPDFLRRYDAVNAFVRDMHKAGKVVAAVCHAGWVLASADVVRGKTVTCFSAIKDDVKNAGGNYVDREVAVDGNLITARKPDDLPAFCREIVAALAKASAAAR